MTTRRDFLDIETGGVSYHEHRDTKNLESNIFVIGPRDPKPQYGVVINTTSRSNNWSKGLSPFFLGPCKLYDGNIAQNVENAWQYSKVYKQFTNEDGNPSETYFKWAKDGWSRTYANRYPMGRGAIPEYSYWNGKHKEIYKEKKEVFLWDFDGYNHKELKMDLKQVLNCEERKMGHAFVLAKMLENDI
jgi:hypothetical protein